jgi:hypothetical protein
MQCSTRFLRHDVAGVCTEFGSSSSQPSQATSPAVTANCSALLPSPPASSPLPCRTSMQVEFEEDVHLSLLEFDEPHEYL